MLEVNLSANAYPSQVLLDFRAQNCTQDCTQASYVTPDLTTPTHEQVFKMGVIVSNF